jgi:hypothetical protein
MPLLSDGYACNKEDVMIKCYLQSHEGRVVADAVPMVGQTVLFRDYGEAVVVSLFHTATDNYIVLQLQDAMDPWTFRLTVKE